MQVTYREKKKVKFRVSFIFLFIIASFAACFALYMKEDDFVITDDMFEEEAESVVYIEPISQGNMLINPVPKSEKQTEDYYDSAVFVGSKTLSGLADYDFVSAENMLLSDSIKLNNFNNVILSSDGVENTISEAVINRNAESVYIMIGLYELGNIDEASIFNQLEAFIDGVKDIDPDIQIYLMSVLPVTAEAESSTAPNADIDAYNSLLLKFADKEKVHYIDVNTEFKGNDGKLPASSAEINGVRLKKESYVQLSDYILSHIAE